MSIIQTVRLSEESSSKGVRGEGTGGGMFLTQETTQAQGAVDPCAAS